MEVLDENFSDEKLNDYFLKTNKKIRKYNIHVDDVLNSEYKLNRLNYYFAKLEKEKHVSETQKYRSIVDNFVINEIEYTLGKFTLKHEYLRILFMGKTGAGKSAVINHLTNTNHQTSRIDLDSVTKDVELVCGSFFYNKKRRNVIFFDTEGFKSGKFKKMEQNVFEGLFKIIQKIRNRVIDVIFIVFKYGRIDNSDLFIINTITNMFCGVLKNKIFIIFTNLDQLYSQFLEDIGDYDGYNFNSFTHHYDRFQTYFKNDLKKSILKNTHLNIFLLCVGSKANPNTIVFKNEIKKLKYYLLNYETQEKITNKDWCNTLKNIEKILKKLKEINLSK